MSLLFAPYSATVNLNNPYGEVELQANKGETIEQFLARASQYEDRDISSVLLTVMAEKVEAEAAA